MFPIQPVKEKKHYHGQSLPIPVFLVSILDLHNKIPVFITFLIILQILNKITNISHSHLQTMDLYISTSAV